MRIIARLDVKNQNLIKGINLEGLRVIGPPNKFAIKYFEKSDEHEEKYIARKTTPSQVFIKRSEEFKKNPPAEDWDGTYALGSK